VGKTNTAVVSDTEDMVRCHLPLVKFMASQVYKTLPGSSGVDIRDLIQEGALGLMAAADRYDASSGVPFSTFARFRIRGAMLDSLRRLATSTRAQRRKWKENEQARREESALPLHAEPAPGSAAAAAAAPVVCEQTMVPLASFPGSDLPAGPMLHPEVMVSNRQARETLQAAINELDQPCQFVVTRYALGTLTMKQISTQLGVSESRVSQIYKQARESMSRTLKSRGIYSSGDLLPGRLPRTPAGVLAAGASSDARGAHEDMTVE
jgi:RNA polymerase sigma factor for flagellar operon FliA